MPLVRTIFQPWRDIDVDDAECASLAAMGLLAPVPPAATEPAATAENPDAPAADTKTTGDSATPVEPSTPTMLDEEG